ncbi:MAG: hypothetical protein ACOVQT_06550 [Rubrivivax sp.]|jgi:hypothetical protein
MATIAPSTPASAPESIGNATMRDDRSLELMLRAVHDDGSIAEMLLVLAPEDAEYAPTLQRLGPMQPGDSRLLPPG